ncbi:phosphoenolpyruvate synthase [Propionicimonas paludicola]|uniref:Phosphoenolpyruvate synthase n=1 Tax=Propionicimonas paludicola TaxID=185243 RepID=A0A2A9CVD8_9ACTN|nr:CPBP family intramembrane glutamic endopeptidase [Propionicimonas paludicola]PFG18368.1 phosphoenolpyruvate synthase [Propionicimonas paludicola]
MSVDVATSRWRSVAWKRVAQYYGIAFGGAIVVGLGIWGIRQVLPASLAVITQTVTAVFYMPLPIVAGLIVERLDRRRPLIAEEWAALRHHFFRTYARNAGTSLAVMIAILLVGFAAAWLAPVLGIPGAGHLATSTDELRQRLLEISPGLSPKVALPDPAALAATLLLQGALAGITINALFAFGEEYGWRGVLAGELRPLGVLRSNLVIGVLWGLWHAPIIILMGHNYGDQWALGVPMMVAWTVPLSFLLTWVKERTGSVLAPAMLHGAYNGTIGIFALLIIGGDLFIALPMGWLLVAVLTILAIIAWRFPPQPRSAQTV